MQIGRNVTPSVSVYTTTQARIVRRFQIDKTVVAGSARDVRFTFRCIPEVSGVIPSDTFRQKFARFRSADVSPRLLRSCPYRSNLSPDEQRPIDCFPKCPCSDQ